jgi:hypothetical protein
MVNGRGLVCVLGASESRCPAWESRDRRLIHAKASRAASRRRVSTLSNCSLARCSNAFKSVACNSGVASATALSARHRPCFPAIPNDKPSSFSKIPRLSPPGSYTESFVRANFSENHPAALRMGFSLKSRRSSKSRKVLWSFSISRRSSIKN